ncbi:MAG: hypothetical protein P4L92_00170 [Rudaea sp.]|nr:hypothetical protein [Rudaea sp.]
MLDMVAPRFISLDTSHWVGLCRSLGDKASNPSAARALRKLSAEGWILAMSLHQVQELLAHKDERLAIARLSTLRHVLTMATIAGVDDNDMPGSVVDVQRLEIMAAIHHPTFDAQAVRQNARAAVFRVTTGDAVVEAIMPLAHVIREHTLARQARTRETASISQATVLDGSRMPFDLNGAARSSSGVAAHCDDLSERLAKELAERGDPRITDPRGAAKEFVDSIAAHRQDIVGSAQPVAEILKIAGLTVEDVASFKNVGQIAELSHFRRNIGIASDGTGIAADELRHLSQERLPTWVVHRALLRHRAVATQAQGGDLTDSHLLSLAPYFHTTFVDKRTLENVRRIRDHDSAAGGLLGDVRKASSWSKALDLLLAGSPPK